VELRERLKALIPRLRGRRIMVVGDLVVDRYVIGEPARLSREAPVVIARYRDERFILGGAANAARNLLALGAEVLPIGVAGSGPRGSWLVREFEQLGVETRGIVRLDGYATVTKTRFLIGEANRTKQQVLRLDREPAGPPGEEATELLLHRIRESFDHVDAILLSDYSYGVVDDAVIAYVRERARGRTVTADSRYRIAAFRGVTLATPNESELEAATGRATRSTSELEAGGSRLLGELGCDGLLVTRGNQGMALFREGVPRLDIPATGSDEVTDVSGAGDTVIAVATAALAAGAGLAEAAHLANLAAGIVVMKIGAATCSPEEIQSVLEGLP